MKIHMSRIQYEVVNARYDLRDNLSVRYTGHAYLKLIRLTSSSIYSSFSSIDRVCGQLNTHFSCCYLDIAEVKTKDPLLFCKSN